MSFVERVNQGESLASWLNWLTEPPAVSWSVIMGYLSAIWKGEIWTHPNAFRTGPGSCAVHNMRTLISVRPSVCLSVRPSVRPSHLFYTPVWKTDVLCYGNVSVRPSVRPSFPDFFSTCFEISIWNLVYAFSRWHDMSSLSFITIGSLWPSLQPKVGQTQFLQSWPYKSR